TPLEYMSAVSKKLMPLSIASLKKGKASASGSIQLRHTGFPKLMQPRQSRDTVTPVRPSNVYFMAPTPGVVMEQFYRKSIRRGCKDRKRKRPRTLAVRGHFFCERVKPGLVGRRDLDV